MTSEYAIGDVPPDRWKELARFLARALPNPMVSVLGPSFGAKFYRALAERPGVASFLRLVDPDKYSRLLGRYEDAKDAGADRADG